MSELLRAVAFLVRGLTVLGLAIGFAFLIEPGENE